MVNLSGLQQIGELGVEKGLIKLLAESAKSTTEREIATILRNPEFFGRTTWYLDGVEVLVDRAAVIGGK
jgi:hypothetical protein